MRLGVPGDEVENKSLHELIGIISGLRLDIMLKDYRTRELRAAGAEVTWV